MELVQGDVSNRDCIIVDDMIDTGGTMIKCIDQIKELGAKRVFVYATHGLFNGNFYDELAKIKSLECLYVSDSLPVKDENKEKNLPITRLSLKELIQSKIQQHWDI